MEKLTLVVFLPMSLTSFTCAAAIDTVGTTRVSVVPGFEHTVFDRIVSLAEKYLDILRGTNPGAGRCFHGFTKFNNKCYIIFDFPVTWSDAQKFCNVLNGELASIDNVEIQQFLQEKLTKGSFASGSFWLGATDKETNNKFRWTDRHGKTRDLQYTKWRGSNPTDDSKSNNDCLEIFRQYNSEWNDLRCTEKRGFICQGQS